MILFNLHLTTLHNHTSTHTPQIDQFSQYSHVDAPFPGPYIQVLTLTDQTHAHIHSHDSHNTYIEFSQTANTFWGPLLSNTIDIYITGM